MSVWDAYVDRIHVLPSRIDLDRSSQTSTLQYVLEINQITQILRKTGFQGIMKGGIFEAEALRNFYAISASCSLFLRVFAGCSSMRQEKEKPPETYLFPVV